MTSEADIANLALFHLGETTTITSLADATPNGRACAQYYPLARDAALAEHDWGFASTYDGLSTTGTPPSRWQYQYAYPADCLQAREITRPLPNSQPIEFEVGQTGGVRMLWTNQSEAELRYTAKITDTTRFSPGFILALSLRLAFHIGPVLGKTSAADRNTIWNQYINALATAASTDASEQCSRAQLDFTPEWLSGRGYNG